MKKIFAFTLALTLVSASLNLSKPTSTTTFANAIETTTFEHVCGA